MRTRIIICLSLLMHVLSVQAQEFNWATSVSGENYEYGVKTENDLQGNTYIFGYSTGTPFTYDGVSYDTNGDGDTFFAKFDTNKQLVWIKSIGGDDSVYYDEALDIHVDLFGDIYLSFESSGNNFTYDGQVLSGINSPGQYSGEAVLLKVNSNGNYIWHDSGATSSSFQAITTDAVGNVYITGYFRNSITLGGAITVTNPSSGTTTDMVVAKYQPDGTILWAKNAGGTPHNTFAYGYDIEINTQSDEVIVLGRSDGEVFYDGVPTPANSNGDEGIVLISYDLDGTQNWVKQILIQPSNWASYGISLDISPSGIIGACGYKNSGVGLVGFYTRNGTIISENAYTSSESVRTYSIAFNEFNEAYVSGRCTTDALLGISPGTVSLSGTTGFIVKMDIYQQVKWVSEFQASSFKNRVHYNNGKVLYAGRIDSNFVYNSGQDVIVNDYGDAIYGELVDLQLPANRCNITGTVFQDLDANCVLDPTDVEQSSVIVKAIDSNNFSYFSISDANGEYDIPVNTGSYTVEILPNPIQSSLIEQSCYTQQQVTLNQLGQDANDINFPMELANCPLLSVDIASDRRRRCFESNTYVSYNNAGFADAQNVEVIVKFPEYVTFVSSDHTYTIDASGNYVFDVGVLAPNQSGVIHIIDSTDCIQGITGLTQCTEAWITPANDCADAIDPGYPNWDRSSARVAGTCVNNNLVQFTIHNAAGFGTGDMSSPQEYRIYVDNALALTSTYQLDGGESVLVEYPANGQTIRIEVDQHPLHPGNSHPQLTIEGCGSDPNINNGEISMGFVNTMPMDDADVNVEVDCLEIIDSYDPNDKAVSPTGITDNHYIEAGTLLDYKIRFQNTGTDTAYTVIVKDSITEHLDPSTIQWGTSSHPYSINITGTDRPVIEFIFNNINLPDSTSNEVGSHGFVKFKASTYGGLPNGTVINNNANIYFDYNLPILTNTAQTTISDMVLIHDPLSVETYLAEDVAVYPNPTSGRLVIESTTLEVVEIYNISGVLIETTAKNEIDLSQYSKGMYLVKIFTSKGTALKKIILK